MKKLFLLLFPFFLQAQDVAIGNWKDYLSYNSASYIAEANNKIYCVASGGLFYITKEDNTIHRLSKVTGLSDVGVKQVAYSNSLKTTVIIYENCNVDLLKNNQIINISDIKRKEIPTKKEINNISLRSGIAYLSCSFGLVLIDLEKEEIKDTYSLGAQGESLTINGCAFLGDSIVLATVEGMYFADANSPNLSDYNNWTLYHNSYSTYDDVISYNGDLDIDHYTSIISLSYNNNTLIRAQTDKIGIHKDDGTYAELIHEKFEDIQHAWIDNEAVIWVADDINGLLKFEGYNYQGDYTPEGPVRNDIYSLEFLENNLYHCYGGHLENFWQNAGINDGVSIKNNYDFWVNYDRYELGDARDILEVAVRNGVEYYASWYHGIVEMKYGELITKHGIENTNGVLDTAYSSNKTRISDIKFDSEGNLWGLNSEVNHPLFVKTNNNQWFSFSMNQNPVNLFFDDLLIDSYNQKWGIIGRGDQGIFVYDENRTFDNPNDDQYKLLSTGIGYGNLPSKQTYCLEEDLNGEIWVGTDKGIGVFYTPSSIFSGGDFDAQQILIQEGDYGQYLLNEEKVKCIAIDGANRKWIGTEKSGVFLLSEDGLKKVLHFTAENSPLFSNNIIDIAINHENGEVFIGTIKGLISYRSDATEGEVTQTETHVFPNPVRESYNGVIAISGLIANANVKITDVDGNLVFEDFAKGGQAIWNGKTKNGNRASTGVYLVFSTDTNGAERAVSKILFIR